MFTKTLIKASAILIFLAQFAAAQVDGLSNSQRAYLIGPNDEITAKVLGEERWDFIATVDQDGLIEIPFFNDPIVAKCKSERELRVEVTKLLSKYLRSPQISLRVTKRNSRPPVSVFGAVMQQQQLDLTRRAYLLEIISFAGVDSEKSGGTVQVFRTRPPMCGDAAKSSADWSGGSREDMSVPSKTFTLTAIQSGDEVSNPEIMPGDIIMVQKASPVYVTGEVIKPGEIAIPEGGLPLTQAIAMASGISREAKTKNIFVYRKKADSPKPEILSVNLDKIRKGTEADLMLKPFDIVVVDKAKKSFQDIILEALSGIPSRVPIPLRPF